jgi:hypothetical protein
MRTFEDILAPDGVANGCQPETGTVRLKAILGAGLVALCPVSGASAQSVTGNPEMVEPASATSDAPGERFRSTMDQVFSPGRWRQTSGYRTPAQEDELRRQGAGAVPAGRVSRHSLGGPDAPGAYDVAVRGMSAPNAAAKLRQFDQSFARVVAEAAHGGQGPHLHIEPRFDRAARPAPKAVPDDAIYARIVDGKRNPQLTRASLR